MIFLFFKKLLRFIKRKILYVKNVSKNIYLSLANFLLERKPSGCTIYYIDAGLHVEGDQLSEVMSWLAPIKNVVFVGFEANPEHFIKVNKKFSGCPNLYIENYALVGPEFESGEISFYVDPGGKGLGDTTSVIRAKERRMKEISVPAIRLSTYLKKLGVRPGQDTILLRMNIEGAELDVLKDLKDVNWINKIDGYYGSWSDVYKISSEDGRVLDKIKSDFRINNIAFNSGETKKGRKSMMMKSIRFHLVSVIRRCV